MILTFLLSIRASILAVGIMSRPRRVSVDYFLILYRITRQSLSHLRPAQRGMNPHSHPFTKNFAAPDL